MPAGWAAAATAVVGAGSAYMQSEAAEDATAQQTNASNRSISAQRTQDSLTRLDNAPFMKTGTAANKRLALLLGIGDPSGIEKPTMDDARNEHLKEHINRFGTGYTDQSDMVAKEAQTQAIYERMMQEYAAKTANGLPAADPAFGSMTKRFSAEDLAADPVYNSGLKFGLDRGTEGINSRAMAGGMYDSGATLKALTQFGNDYGSTKANESYNRFNATNDSIYNKLAGTSGAGQTATSQVAASGANMANNVSNSLEGAGNARAAGVVAGANAWGGAAGGVNNAIGNYQNNQRYQALMDDYNYRRSGGAGNNWASVGGIDANNYSSNYG